MDMTEALPCSGGTVIIPSTGSTGRLGVKLEDEADNTLPPALPPRPPPRSRNPGDLSSPAEMDLKRTRVKKYVFLCSVCGGLASLLGGMFLAVYLVLRSYTSSLDYFETIPTYIPAAMLMVTGLGVMCLARRRNRFLFLIKLCGLCCLLCVAACVLVTVTTTVLHMSRLQSLRECVYTIKTQTCTCYSVLLESASERTDEASRYVFNATPDCEVIHGTLYFCLRVLFGLSVIGILVCIFCCMLVYQLLSHERKKMYWEQLELRCRYLYGQTTNSIRPPQTPSGQATQHCSCCHQFRYQQDILTWEPSESRFWSGAQVGNLYTPNPVGEDCGETRNVTATSSGWSWRRLPWTRQPPQPSSASHRSWNSYQQPLNCSSPDSQYGFNCEQGRVATVSSASGSYTTIDPVAPTGCQVYHWGPPPPYSDPNSPHRSQLHHCQRAGNYVNTADESSNAGLQVRIPNRRPDLPMSSSSSSSVKSSAIHNLGDSEFGRSQRSCHRDEVKPVQRGEGGGWRECGVSPRIKYLHNKLQNMPVNPIRKRIQEPSESEVYFADVSSCNVSVRNDSMSVYGETFDIKLGERMLTMSNKAQDSFNENTVNGRTNPSPDLNERNSSLKTVHSDLAKSENMNPGKEVAVIQMSPSKMKCSYQGSTLDGSEEDDPELVDFSQRETSTRRRLPHYREDVIPKTKRELEDRCPEPPLHKNQTEIPSPMSISSPSTISKDTGGFYAEAVHSDDGSLDSVWSEYSPDLLAPDAQYEVIPEHKSEDLNGNVNESSGSRSRLMPNLTSKKRHYPPVLSENRPFNSPIRNEGQHFNHRHKCGGHQVNSPKGMDRPQELIHKSPRPSEHCLADILNNPKTNPKSTKNEQITNNALLHRHNDITIQNNSESVESRLYYSISDSENNTCDRSTSNRNTFDRPSNDKTQRLDGIENTNVPKVMERVKLINSNCVNTLEPSDTGECFRRDNSCVSYSSLDISDLNQVKPVNV